MLSVLPKFDDVAIKMYLIVFAKTRRPSATPAARIPRSLHDVGGVLRYVRRGLDGDPNIGVVQRDGIVHAVTQKADRVAGCELKLDQARFLVRRDARENGGRAHRLRQRLVVQLLDVGALEDPANGHGKIGADLLRHEFVVTGDDLDLNAELLEPRNRSRGIGLGRICEGEESRQR